VCTGCEPLGDGSASSVADVDDAAAPVGVVFSSFQDAFAAQVTDDQADGGGRDLQPLGTATSEGAAGRCAPSFVLLTGLASDGHTM